MPGWAEWRNVFAVLEHIVRVHRRMDEGLENEVVVILLVSVTGHVYAKCAKSSLVREY